MVRPIVSFFLLIVYGFFPSFSSAAVPLKIDQERSLVFRFTGDEANRLNAYLKERTLLESDFGQVYYRGERMSLACSELDDCYLWLDQREWHARTFAWSTALVFDFTLPLAKATLIGQLSVSPDAGYGSAKMELTLQDAANHETFALEKPLSCPMLRPSGLIPLEKKGDCRLDLSPVKPKNPNYAESIQYVQNADNVILTLKGPWAEKLFRLSDAVEVDPNNSERLRVQLGPGLFCWNLNPFGTAPYEVEPFACQADLSRAMKVGNDENEEKREENRNEKNSFLQFSTFGSYNSGITAVDSYSLVLRPTFKDSLLFRYELFFNALGQEIFMTTCPTRLDSSPPRACRYIYNTAMDVGIYPIANPVQGVAVGWGLVKERSPETK